MKKILCLFVFAVLITGLTMVVSVHANHIQVGIPTLAGQNTTSHYVDVQFDLSWENSWRTDSAPNNWDAAWVFVKYKVSSGDWNHAYLNTTAGNHTIQSGYTCSVGLSGSYGMGVFIYRNENGSGNTSLSNVKLRWEYGDNEVADGDNVTVKVFGVEMVYIPAGDFYLGDGSSYGRFHQTGSDSVQITTTGAVVKCEDTPHDDAQLEGAGILVDGDGGIDKDDTTAVNNANYPTGYTAFYCMKHEVSQGQYADFLNTLTGTQDEKRYYFTISSRYTIGIPAGSRSAGVPDRACNFLSWMDGCAYADWAGLRPMTELEFEKVCRGTESVVLDEFAWGENTIVADAPLTISGDENGTETITTDVSLGACCYGNNTHTGGDGGYGPLRCGIFATGSPSRIEAGASYYGMLELSGNLWERPVTLGNLEGRSFEGTHGDGSLSDNGHATNSDWPGESGGEVTGALGAGNRGGSWPNHAFMGQVSDRAYAAFTVTDRSSNIGFRGVRSAP